VEIDQKAQRRMAIQPLVDAVLREEGLRVSIE
jgi:hypothetical protein